MQVNINIGDREKYHILTEIFSFSSPFKNMSRRERQVYAELNYYYNKLPGLDDKKKNKLIFDYDTRREISEHLGVKPEQIYNIIALLKKKKLVTKNSLVARYILPDVDKLTFNFNKYAKAQNK